MNPDRPTLGRQLEALGRILDERNGSLKEVCILQAGDGFIVQGFEARFGREHSSYVPVTIQVEAAALRAALAPAETKPAAAPPWWRRA
jgi:hypothetical protein